jgi:hypothetical protein
MKLSCFLRRHSAVPSDVRNLGLRFSQCRCCGRDMIHFRGSWKTAPRGFRIVWRRVDEIVADAVPRKLIRNLPVLSPSAGRTSVQDMVRRVVELVDLFRAGLRLAGWAIAERCRTLGESLLEPLRPRQFVLPLRSPSVIANR